MERSPGDAIARLRDRLAEEFAKQGLTLRQFAFVPGGEGEKHMVQAFATVDDEFMDPGKAENDRYDAEFDEIAKRMAIDSREQAVRDKLERGMGSIEGLLGDDDEDDGLAPA